MYMYMYESTLIVFEINVHVSVDIFAKTACMFCLVHAINNSSELSLLIACETKSPIKTSSFSLAAVTGYFGRQTDVNSRLS